MNLSTHIDALTTALEQTLADNSAALFALLALVASVGFVLALVRRFTGV